jgi:hypothetical protein
MRKGKERRKKNCKPEPIPCTKRLKRMAHLLKLYEYTVLEIVMMTREKKSGSL